MGFGLVFWRDLSSARVFFRSYSWHLRNITKNIKSRNINGIPTLKQFFARCFRLRRLLCACEYVYDSGMDFFPGLPTYWVQSIFCRKREISSPSGGGDGKSGRYITDLDCVSETKTEVWVAESKHIKPGIGFY